MHVLIQRSEVVERRQSLFPGEITVVVSEVHINLV